MPPNMKLLVLCPGMPGQALLLRDPGQGGEPRRGEEVHRARDEPMVQAEGIVNRSNWYPGSTRARPGFARPGGVGEDLQRRDAGGTSPRRAGPSRSARSSPTSRKATSRRSRTRSFPRGRIAPTRKERRGADRARQACDTVAGAPQPEVLRGVAGPRQVLPERIARSAEEGACPGPADTTEARRPARPDRARAPPGALPGRLRLGYREPARPCRPRSRRTRRDEDEPPLPRPARPPRQPAADRARPRHRRPALLYPLGYSLVWAFLDEKTGGWSLANFTKAFDFHSLDSGSPSSSSPSRRSSSGSSRSRSAATSPSARTGSRWPPSLAYRWPLFIPFVVAGQHAHLPRQERDDEQHAGRQRGPRSAQHDELPSTGGGSSSPSCGSRPRSPPSSSRGRCPRSTARPWRRPGTSGRGGCGCSSRSWSRRSRPPSWSPLILSYW